MREFVRSAFSFRKLQGLCVNTALGNFVGYVAGSLVTLFTTYHAVERRALKNLFGILPRHTVVVHRLPQWLEWSLSILLGYLVMEFVRYIVASYRQLPHAGTSDQPASDGRLMPVAQEGQSAQLQTAAAPNARPVARCPRGSKSYSSATSL